VFYSAKEWGRKTEGVEGSRIALGMCWICLKIMEHPDRLMQFGEDGNVKRFSVETIGAGQRPANYFHNNVNPLILAYIS
jgi:hypothetical protein